MQALEEFVPLSRSNSAAEKLSQGMEAFKTQNKGEGDLEADGRCNSVS